MLFIEAMMMIVCSGLSLYLGEDDTMAFIISTILTILGGIGLKYLGRDANNALGRRDAYLLVTLTWVIFSLFGSFPFLISGYVTNFTDAYFETMSGFTTTGSSIIDDVEKLPHGMLFWRSMTQWVGALGIVFFTIAHPHQDAPTVRDNGKMDLEHLLTLNHQLRRLLLPLGNGSFRLSQLFHDHHGDRRIFHT